MSSAAEDGERLPVRSAEAAPDPPDSLAAWQVAIGLLGAPDMDTMLRRVVEAGRSLAGAAAAAILLYDPERRIFQPAEPGGAVGLDERWPRPGLEDARALARRAAEAQEVVDVPDTTAVPEMDLPLLAGERRPGALWVAPLASQGGLLGVLELFDAEPRRAQRASAVLRVFAVLAAEAIASARGRERERIPRARLEALDEASRALAAGLSLTQVLRRIVEVAAAIVDARYGALGVAGSDGYLHDFITSGITVEERERIGDPPRGHGLLGVLIHIGTPLRIPDMRRDPRRVGFPPNHPPMTSLLGVPIRVRDEVVGDLYLADKIGGPEFSEEDQQLIERFAAHAGIAIENARLYAQVGEITMLRERARIARDLHDGIIQDIYAAILHLEDIAEDLSDQAPRKRIMDVADHLSGLITDVRMYIQGLRIRYLEGRLLAEGIRTLTQESDGRAGLAATCVVEGEVHRLPDEQANTLLLIAREALSNVAKHAAAAQVVVRLAYNQADVTLTVADDGRGFDPQLPRGEEHRGLDNLRARTEEAGGNLTLHSMPDAGTTLIAYIPAKR
jgi:signal transduction histidine kinase